MLFASQTLEIGSPGGIFYSFSTSPTVVNGRQKKAHTFYLEKEMATHSSTLA